jgi:hypothetical protein
MPVFSVGDIVRVVLQPSDMLAHIVGEVGYIDNMSTTHAMFNGLRLNGSRSGCGSVNLNCLELETSPNWRLAKEILDANLAQRLVESKERTERYHARMAELSAKYGISVENIEALYSDIEALDSRGWWPEEP